MESFVTLIQPFSGLVGVILGGVLSLFVQNSLYKNQARIRIIEKVYDKRLNAYEKLYVQIKNLRTMKPIYWDYSRADEEKLIRIPVIISDEESFNEYLSAINEAYHEYSHWYSTELNREYYYLQDYLLNLKEVFDNIPIEGRIEFGNDIRSDIIEIGSRFDSIFQDFYSNQIYKLDKESKLPERHKLQKEETYKRMEKTQLMRYRKMIENRNI